MHENSLRDGSNDRVNTIKYLLSGYVESASLGPPVPLRLQSRLIVGNNAGPYGTEDFHQGCAFAICYNTRDADFHQLRDCCATGSSTLAGAGGFAGSGSASVRERPPLLYKTRQSIADSPCEMFFRGQIHQQERGINDTNRALSAEYRK
jgi:hypothetical protein